MEKLKHIEGLVECFIEAFPALRVDDYSLYYYVCKHYFYQNGKILEFQNLSFTEAMLKHKEYKLPSFESVTRCRRRVQAKRPELKDPAKARIRAEAEQDFRAYARS